MNTKSTGEINKCVRIAVDGVFLLGDLHLPEESSAVVLFAHDGRCQNNLRNQHVAQVLRDRGVGTLLCDLLTADEAAEDDLTEKYRHDAVFLAKRLRAVTKWVVSENDTKNLRLGYLGACTGGAAALIAAVRLSPHVRAVVSRGGRLDLAAHLLSKVTCPTLLIVGEHDTEGLDLHRKVFPHLTCKKELRIVTGASHLFGEPRKLKAMAVLSADWFSSHLGYAGDYT